MMKVKGGVNKLWFKNGMHGEKKFMADGEEM